jgi:hypothetical protein
MADNPLLRAVKPTYVDTRSALEWARSAKSRGDFKAEALWLAEARRRGEIA